ncbi:MULTISPECIES: S8/S53 family peptidase [unclassified Streptomyces]|uniref:S8/S53 family peptidase n=1 Tax=unclassified Streptomyces TaxID=2593676 RepID=UPI0022773958|nr:MULTISPECIES: S8/S53 family peptidase [unclassified Streptomyces]
MTSPFPPFERFPPFGPPYLTHLLWEPGFQLQATQGGSGIPDPFDAGKLSDLVNSKPNIPSTKRAAGHRVAVLDTGVRGVVTDMVDFLDCDQHGVRVAAADDPHGHGTAVAKVIEAVEGSAIIHPLRVLNKDKVGQSYEVLAGLMHALWSGQYDLINASLSTQLSESCDTSMGRSIDYTVRYCTRAVDTPVLVAAAGNGNGASSGYPARVPESVVALALDTQGALAPYNSTPPQGATTESAYGGSDSDSLGDLNPMTGLTGPAASLWGTSFAAAVVSGAHLP